MWHPDDYLEQLYTAKEQIYGLQATNMQDFRAQQAQLRDTFVQLLGGFPLEKAALEPTLLESVDCGEYQRERVELTTYAGLRMPVYVLIPHRRTEELPAVIACHGHGYGSKDIVGLTEEGTERTGEASYQKDFAIELVKQGYVTVAPELLGFGDRRLRSEAANNANNSCDSISKHLLVMGHTMAGHRTYEVLRCIDYVQERNEVDPQKIGIMGISGGGLVSAFASALDERIRSVVISGYVNTFKDSILSIRHCIDNYVPGLSRIAEMPDLISLIAPRPLLVEAGKRDHIFPYEAVKKAVHQLEHVYALFKASDRLQLDAFDGGHEIYGKHAYEWFATLSS